MCTLGCKVNQYDSQKIREGLAAQGHSEARFGEAVDMVVVNTCTVTHRADADGRRAVRKALRTGAEVVVTGCQAVVYPEALRRAFPSARVVRPDHVPTVLGIETPRFVSGLKGHSRAFVVVQTGCDRFCTYCVVPHARGVPRSRPWQEVVGEVAHLVNLGVEEVVLTGVNTGLYEGGLTRLVQKVLRYTSVKRVRLSSLEPFTVEDCLADLLADEPRVCAHLHLSVQHASDRILASMGRPLSSRALRSLVELLSSSVLGLSLGADVIVGFPGETERDFLETYAFFEELPFSYLHVFPFSPRPGTRASSMEARVDPGVVSMRSRALRSLSQRKRRAFAASRVGSVEEVLVTRAEEGGVFGVSSTYLGVFSSTKIEPGGIVPVRITGVQGHVLTGEPLVQ